MKDKDFGPLVKTSMTRCIHCTRCIRFPTEVAGVAELGATGPRREHGDRHLYRAARSTSELSANIIDLCPVGALTSKPYAFVARPWELTQDRNRSTCSTRVGSNIRVDARGPAGAARAAAPQRGRQRGVDLRQDALRARRPGKRQRLDRPYVRRDGKLEEATWPEAFAAIAARLKGVAGSAHRRDRRRSGRRRGDAGAEGSDGGAGLAPSRLPPGRRRARSGAAAPATCSTPPSPASSRPMLCSSIGTNPRAEAAMLNARLRKRWLQGGFKVAAIGPTLDLTFPVRMLGAGPATLAAIGRRQPSMERGAAGGEAADADPGAGRAGARRRRRDARRWRASWPRAPGWSATTGTASTCCTPPRRASAGSIWASCRARAGAMSPAFSPAAATGEIEAVYLLGADEIDMAAARPGLRHLSGPSRRRRRAPRRCGAAGRGLYREGRRPTSTPRAACSCGQPRRLPAGRGARGLDDPARAVRARWAGRCPTTSLGALRGRMVAVNPVFAEPRHACRTPAWGAFGARRRRSMPRRSSIRSHDFYRTDPISRASPTMAECSRRFGPAQRRGAARPGTHG